MLTAIAATLVLHTVSGAAPVAPYSVMTGNQQMATWADVDAYLAAHATQRNAQAEALMEEEATAGDASWSRFTAASGGGQWQPIPDGSGIGWPSLGLVVRFGSAAHMNAAADLIEEVAGLARNRSLTELFPQRIRGARIASSIGVQP